MRLGVDIALGQDAEPQQLCEPPGIVLVIGSIALLPDPKRKNDGARMVDCALAREQWCGGLMTEAAQALLEYAFHGLGLELVSAYCSPNNGRVRRVLEKCGLQFEGVLRRWLRRPSAGDEPVDCRCYALVK